ncbi:acyl-CoA dehydrogenase [Nocardioides stalactiti]|uniref:acyl-CoA dehydrogenase n=1 Tax=Nocardioides stalactiti TaxID=2755356 RepID=UPI0016010EFE|nr:acyl-CoA dehydrogenase [Nocardioides stalactiti]
MSLLLSRRDLEFLLYEWIDVERLTARERFAEHSRETFDAALELAETIATEHFAPHNKLADAHEPTFDGERVHLVPEVARALEVYFGSGLMTASMDEAVGGGQLPHTVASAAMAWFQAANAGTSGYPFLTLANANLLLAHGSPEQVERWVRPMLEGRFLGTMCLSEPGAGSSLADVTTRAEPQADGSYRLFGNKMWISAGEHELSENIVHLVLARVVGAPAGVKGLSLFVVPKVLPDGTRNDVTLAGLNHKMGFRGTTNTLLNFGERGGAVGDLVGEEGRGLAAMFHMMNEARIGVGLGATALGYTGYLKSLRYAKERLQGRPVGTGGAPVPIAEHADVKRMLLAQKSYVEGALALLLYCSRLVDEEKTAADPAARAAAHLLLEVLTPIAKSWPSQWCLAANDLAIQVHGGYGYTRDYDVEQHYRDNRLNPIHEGTHGIQAQDLLGRKVVMDGGAGLLALVGAIRSTIERAGDSEQAAALSAVVDRVVEVTRTIWAPGDPELGLANASLYLEAVGHTVVAWMWLEQVLAAGDAVGDFYDGKRAAAAYFFRYELPRTAPQLDLLATLDRTTIDTPTAWL